MPRAAERTLRHRATLRAVVLVATLAVFAGDAAIVRAHGERNAHVRAVIDDTALPAELAGMRIEVHETVGPQLVLANPTAREVEVLDAGGIAFLRIGPAGVEANVAARAWFQTFSPGTPVPIALRSGDGQPRWTRARREPSFGWFDPRLDAGSIEVPHDVLDAAATRDVGRWQIPLRVDGQPVLLTGTFRWEPLPRGGYAARLTSPAEIAPGVLVRLLPGRTPGVLVKSSNRLPLTILDGAGEPFLRIGPDGVDANVRSIAWRRSGRRVIDASDPELEQPAMPRWQRVARTPSFSWIDPRVVDRAEETPGASDSGGRPTMPPVAWHIPVMLGEEPLQIAGSSTWQATVRGTDDARPAKRAASR